MRLLHIILVCCLATISAGASSPGSVCGVVRDAQGKPIAGAVVTLTDPTAAIKKTTTDPAGDYQFTGLADGDYVLHAESNGNTTSANIHIPAAGPVDLTVTAQAHAKLQLQASGLHGLIDPGGYSASATADAASGLVRGIADMKRTTFIDVPKQMPCSLGPELRAEVGAHPDQATANSRLGEFYVAHDEPSKAIPLLNRARQIDNQDTGTAKWLATAQMQSGQFEEAHTLLSALAAQHDEAEVHQLLAKADEGLGDFQHAAQEYRVADREAPSEQSQLGIGYELILAGSPADALASFQSGEQKYPASIALRIGAGTAQFLLGHPAESVRSFLGATNIDASDTRPYPFLIAASGISDAESDRVRNAFKHYLDIEPNRAEANYDYAVILSRDNSDANEPRVETLLKRAIQLDPAMANAHLQLANLYNQRKDFASAIPEYETAIRLSPGLNDAHYRLALAYKRAGRTEESAREMQIIEQAKAGSGRRSDDSDINIDQFISVMNSGQQKGNGDRCSN